MSTVETTDEKTAGAASRVMAEFETWPLKNKIMTIATQIGNHPDSHSGGAGQFWHNGDLYEVTLTLKERGNA
jgi:hypothetical protein